MTDLDLVEHLWVVRPCLLVLLLSLAACGTGVEESADPSSGGAPAGDPSAAAGGVVISSSGANPGAGGGGGTGAGSGGGGANGGGGGASEGSGGLPYILGADVTITLEDEHWGATYTDDGVNESLEAILQDHGFNFVRIDTFVSPGAAGGYAADKPEAFRDLAHTIELAKRVKARGMGFLLDLHMSDTWTNPGAQTMPSAWSGYSLTQLESAVYSYVHDAVSQLAAAGAKPDMVQIGNEVTSGMMWEIGRISGGNFVNFGKLLKSGISAVRAVGPNILVMLHIEKCNDLSTSKWWLDGVLSQGVEFDVLGQSCYADAYVDGMFHRAGYQGAPAEWATVFSALAEDYPALKFVIAEYSAEQRAANDVMRNLPDGRGLGTFNWDPTRFYETHPNVPLFGTSGDWNDYVVKASEMGKYDQMVVDYGL